MLLFSSGRGLDQQETVSVLDHAKCKSFVQAIVFSSVTEGCKPEFRKNYRQNTYETN